MKKIVFLLIFSISNLYSQNIISRNEVLRELMDDKESLQISLIIPNKAFSIGIYPLFYDVEDFTEQQCGDIKTNELKNAKVLAILKERNLLKVLYLSKGNNKYESIDSNDFFLGSEVCIFIQLTYDKGNSGVHQVFIPIKKRKKAKLLVKAITNIFDNKYCFGKFEKHL
ncbi:hypothetical protein [Polaribacter sp. Hel_I_88]|uniref:hypothetical protein n=1 Tax=Polaribacter sp. Hel_I_88 TaxID=1250006 RepID=UPI000559BEC9|nr:hypothetical protein [Polaribacter sp. Hel_I_88]